MNLFRTLRLGLVLAIGASALSGCLTSPDISTTPSISFKSLSKIHVDNPGRITDEDTLVFVLNYEDGDGDLGLTADDLLNPPYYQDPTPGAPINRYQYNYFITPYIRNQASGEFEELALPSGLSFNGNFNFLPLTEDRDKKKPIKGELGYKQVFSLDGPLYAGDELRFTISIMDRALHESNVITTPSIILGE